MKTRKIWIYSGLLGAATSFILYYSLLETQHHSGPAKTVSVASNTRLVSVKTKQQASTLPGSQSRSGNQTPSSKKTPASGGLLPIQHGMRAVSLPLNDPEGVSGFITPGSYIDIVSIIPPTKKQAVAGQTTAAQILLQNVKVLAVGHAGSANGTTYRTLTIQVTPLQGLDLGLAEQVGSLYAMLRGSNDSQTLPTFTNVHEDELVKGVYGH